MCGVSSLEKTDKWHEVLLMNEDKSLSVAIGFYGYTLEQVSAYIQGKYANHKRWVQFKMVK